MITLAKSFLYLFFVTSLALVFIPYFLLANPNFSFGFNLNLFGILPIAVGFSFLIKSAADFALTGKGTPAPFNPPKIFVSKGLYRFVRNPMYVGALFALIGEAILFGSFILVIYAFVLWLIFHLFVVFYEEPNLRKRFGKRYEEYCKRVARWVPRIS